MAASIVLEYLKVILTAPVISGAVGMTFIIMFKGPLRDLIRRIASIKIPGGGELITPQLPTSASDVSTPTIPVPEGDSLVLPEQLNAASVEKVQELFQAERARAYVWEYRYLNLFLVARTIAVLEWLGDLNVRPSVSMYDTLWLPRIPEADQRRTILDVLEAHHLARRDGDLIEISEKGREYLEWKDKV